MLISVCGAQGSGKSTLIDGIMNSSKLTVEPKQIERKTARSVLADWNMTLQEVYADPKLIMKFQDELLQRKYDDEVIAYESDDLWITERTYIDLLAFTVSNVGRLNEYSDWLDEYARKCIAYQSKYNKIIYLQGGKFGIVDDGVRPKNAVYGSMIDTFISSYLERSESPFVKMNVVDIDKRVDQSVELINQVIEDNLWAKEVLTSHR